MEAAEFVDPNSLVPWDENPRINQQSIEPVADSIRRFGFAAPIVARRADNMVIAGHTRLKAALSLGMEQVPVRFLDLTVDEAKALALADNKIGELAMWDDPTLSKILSDLQESSTELHNLGFSTQELEDLMQNADSVFELFDEDDEDDGDFASDTQFADAKSFSFILTGPPDLANDPQLKSLVIAFANEHGLKLKVQAK